MGRTKLHTLVVASLCTAIWLAQATCWTAEQAKPGPIERLAERLTAIFQFRIEGGQLVLDREAWNANADAQRMIYRNSLKNLGQSTDARQQAIVAQQKAGFEQYISSPALGFLMRDIWSDLSRTEPQMVVQNGRLPKIFFQSADRFSCWFQARAVRCSARGTAAAERIELAENDSPRAFTFSNDPAEGFRLELTDGNNDLIVLQQHPDSFAALVIRDDKMFCETSETFVAFVRKHRELVSEFILPNLAQVGIRPVLPFESAEVRRAALDLLTPQTDAEIDADRRAYDRYKKRIAILLQSKGLFGGQVKKITEQTQKKEARETVVAFDLLDDPEYVVSLLDDAQTHELPVVCSRLEQLTGKKLGTDPESWKEWMRDSKARANAQRAAE